jgi:hypothetical protein
MDNKAALLEHPDYLAKVNGVHVPWSIIAKLNPANSDAVKLYVDWTVKRFRLIRKTDPNAFAVSVDPSDGGGHCNSEECMHIGDGSPSDQTYYIANQAARAIRAEFPDGWVNLYGYYEHAMPPSFALEPNVYISVIPYAFQRTGLTPEEFIRAWGRKARRIGMYDYWSIPDWSSDFPSFDFRNTPRERLRFWHDNNVEGFSAESTYSGGAMGPGWYVASRLMWNLDVDDKAVLDEWFELSFGPAQAPMRRMLERWAGGFTLIGNELALSYRDLAEAKRLAANNGAVLRRLADYGRYVEYLRLRHAFDTAAPADRVAAQRELIRHVWRIYHSAMIHSFRIFQLLVRGNSELAAQFPLTKLDAPEWKELRPISDAEIFDRIENQVRALPLLDFSTRRFSGELIPVPENLRPATATPVGAAVPPQMSFVGQVNLSLQVPAGVRELAFQTGSEPPVRVQLRNSDGRMLYDKPTKGTGTRDIAMEDIKIPLPGPGRYRLTLSLDKNTAVRVAMPRDVTATLLPFAVSKGPGSPPLYFFVPKGVRNVAIYDAVALPEVMQPRLWNPAGTEVKAQVSEGRRMLLYPVADGEDGKIWRIARIVAPNGPIDILNAPSTFAFTPEALYVPADALR